MTAWTDSAPFPITGRPSSHIGKALQVQTSLSPADTEARRLAIAVGRGDEAAFQQLYDCYHKRVFRFALVLGHGDESLAGETVQSVFVIAATSLRSVESEEHLWNWLARVARQQIAKMRRQQRQDPRVVELVDLTDCAARCEADSVLEEKLDAALLAIEPEERQLIEWFYFDGLSHKEIAERLDATSKAASSRLERARARLRSLLTQSLSHET